MIINVLSILFYRSLFYISLSIFNIIIFSYISIAIYQIFCLNQDSDFLVYLPSNNNSYSFTVFNMPLNYRMLNSATFALLFLFDVCFSKINIINTHFLLYDYDFYNYHNIFQLNIFTKVSSYSDFIYNSIEFYCLHNFIWIIPNETILIFFRLINSSNFSLDCISIYLIYPMDYSFFFIKLQCFCFSSLYINSNELLEMPVVFFLQLNFFEFVIKKMYIFYLLLPYSYI